MVCRMCEEGVRPTTKTFVLLISAFTKGSTTLDVIIQVFTISFESDHSLRTEALVTGRHFSPRFFVWCQVQHYSTWSI